MGLGDLWCAVDCVPDRRTTPALGHSQWLIARATSAFRTGLASCSFDRFRCLGTGSARLEACGGYRDCDGAWSLDRLAKNKHCAGPGCCGICPWALASDPIAAWAGLSGGSKAGLGLWVSL